MDQLRPPPPDPYQPPRAALETRPAEVQDPASRWQRLAAAVVDVVLVMVARAPMSVQRTDLSWFNLQISPFAGWHLTDARGLLGAALLVGFLVLQWCLVATRGQTVGKLLLGTRISRLDGRPVGFKHGVALRIWIPFVVSWVPDVGPFAVLTDVLVIFGSQRRCVHDFIADTKVVRVAPSRGRASRAEGAPAPILPDTNEQTFEVSAEDEAELAAAMDEADRGAVVDANTLLPKL